MMLIAVTNELLRSAVPKLFSIIISIGVYLIKN